MITTENAASTTVTTTSSRVAAKWEPPWHLPPITAFIGTALAFVGITFAAGAPSPLFVLYQQEWHFPAWVLTVAFAIYALTLLGTLLVAGSLSDHIGRRPVLLGALVLAAIAMLLFVFATNIGWIIAARTIQGIATGAATSTFTAAIVELAPERHKKLGAMLGSTAPLGGLALGALVTGLAVQFTTQPSTLIFSFLTVVFVLGSIVTILSTETVARRSGAAQSLIPRLSVPRTARREFAAAIPLLISTWMLAGLFLGLAPSIIRGIFHIDSGLVNGTLVALLPAAGTIASLVFGRVDARRAVKLGAALVIVGVATIVVGVSAGWFAFLFLGAIIGGTGIGASFSGTLRALAPLADPSARAELFAAIYLVSYLAYGAPALVAGELIGVVGLLTTVIGYSAVAIVAAAFSLLAQRQVARSL